MEDKVEFEKYKVGTLKRFTQNYKLTVKNIDALKKSDCPAVNRDD